jgi:hypothetical protein
MTNLARQTLVVGLVLTALFGVVVLTHSPPRVVRANAKAEDVVASTVGDARACQAGETIPSGVTAIRMWLEAEFGPPVTVRVYAGSRLITHGARGPGWTASSVTVPVVQLHRTVFGAKLCFQAEPNSERLQIYGLRTPASQAAVGPGGQTLGGRMTIEYLAAGHGSWFSRAQSVARRLGLGRAVSGSWLALLVAALMVAVVAVTVRVAWRELA